jgi:hypothetical protein
METSGKRRQVPGAYNQQIAGMERKNKKIGRRRKMEKIRPVPTA